MLPSHFLNSLTQPLACSPGRFSSRSRSVATRFHHVTSHNSTTRSSCAFSVSSLSFSHTRSGVFLCDLSPPPPAPTKTFTRRSCTFARDFPSRLSPLRMAAIHLPLHLPPCCGIQSSLSLSAWIVFVLDPFVSRSVFYNSTSVGAFTRDINLSLLQTPIPLSWRLQSWSHLRHSYRPPYHTLVIS